MYAVVAPGLKGVYDNPRILDKIVTLYPYAVYRKFRTETECWEFLRKYDSKRSIAEIYNYGNTFKKLFVTMEYFIRDSIFYNYRIEDVGFIKIVAPEMVVENCPGLIKARIDNIAADNRLISGHMIAIFHGLRLIGSWLDVNIIMPDHSVFYALHSYTGANRIINKVRGHIKARQGEVAFTIPRRKGGEAIDER
jgi:hypothetical protein